MTQRRPRSSKLKEMGFTMSGSDAKSSSEKPAGTWMNFIDSAGERGSWYFGAGLRFS
jgi:hypothetical protein